MEASSSIRRVIAGVAATAAATAALSVAAPTALAAPQSHPTDPYLPSNGHAYRHGATPTVADQAKIRAWNAAHPRSAASTAAAVGPNTLYYGGGDSGNGVAHSPKVYLVFYGNQWGTQGTDANGNATFTGDPSNGAPAIQNMFKGLGTNSEKWSGVMTQYCDGSGAVSGASVCAANATHAGYPSSSHFGGIYYDNSIASPAAATSAQLAAEAVKAANHFGNTTSASNRDAIYIVLSPHNGNPDNYLNSTFCAWHSATYDNTDGMVAYANMPYVMDRGQSCGADFVNANGALDGYTMVSGHEYAEWMTDMYPNSGWVSAPDASGNVWENADECAWIQPGQQGGSANVAFSTGSYAMQSTWSNDTNECDISHAIIGAQAGNTVTVTSPGNQSGTVGTAASLQVHATDSASGTTLTYSATGLPAGLSINATTGLISGTPTTAGTYNTTVKVTDNTGATGSASFTWTEAPKPGNTVTVTKPANQSATVGTAASLQVQATDSASGTTLTYSATGLPAGLSINATSGLISGTPTTAGTYSTTVKATDNTGAAGSASFTWSVAPKPGTTTVTVTNPGNQSGTVGTAASLQIHATDSSAGTKLTYAATGLPAGLSINATTGLISGTPTTAGTYSVTVKVTDNASDSGMAAFTWTVAPKPTVTCTASQLLSNPGFESGTAGWTSTAGVINTDGWMSRTGAGYAWLDGYSSAATDTLSQTVTIPAGCKAVLSYWLWTYTDQTSSSAIDTLTVTVNGTKVQSFSNLNATSDYVQESVDLSAYAGQSVTIKWTGVQAGATSTSFVIDDTALNTSAAAASTVPTSTSRSLGLSSLLGWL